MKMAAATDPNRSLVRSMRLLTQESRPIGQPRACCNRASASAGAKCIRNIPSLSLPAPLHPCSLDSGPWHQMRNYLGRSPSAPCPSLSASSSEKGRREICKMASVKMRCPLRPHKPVEHAKHQIFESSHPTFFVRHIVADLKWAIPENHALLLIFQNTLIFLFPEFFVSWTGSPHHRVTYLISLQKHILTHHTRKHLVY